MFSPIVDSHVSFPAELKGCINISPEVTKQQLNEALVSENTREIFKAWSAQHREFCNISPLMGEIRLIVEKYDTQNQPDIQGATGGAHLIHRPVLKLTNFLFRHIFAQNAIANQVENHTFNFNDEEEAGYKIRDHFHLFKGYIELGMFNNDELAFVLRTLLQSLASGTSTTAAEKKENRQKAKELLAVSQPRFQEMSSAQITRIVDFYANPLTWKGCFEFFIPKFQALPAEQLTSILSNCQYNFEAARPLLNRLTSYQLEGALRKFRLEDFKNFESAAALFEKSPKALAAFLVPFNTKLPSDEALLSIIEKWPTEEFIQFLSYRNSVDDSILDDYKWVNILTPQLEKLPPEQLMALLPMSNVLSFGAARSLFEKLSIDLQVQGLSRIESVAMLQKAELLIYKLSLEQRVELISKFQDHEVYRASFAKILPHNVKLTPDQKMQIASAQDINGKFHLQDSHLFKELLPWLKGLRPAEQLKAFFLKQDAQGLAFLSGANSEIRELSLKLLRKRGISLDDLVDTDGISFATKWFTKLSDSWLTAPKAASAVVPTMTRQQFDDRVATLTADVAKLWDSLRFGPEEGSLNPAFLVIVGKSRTPESVRKALFDEVLMKLGKQEAWLGTPQKDQREELHRWYSLQLDNFETIIAKKRDKPYESAGYLTSIAAPVFEGRCGSAYQNEIQQSRDQIEENINLDSFVKRAAANSLLWFVEKLARGQHDITHALGQFSYAAGIVGTPDPLPPVTVEAAQNAILNAWNLEDFMREFGHGVDHDIAIEWLKLQTPDTFGPEYKELEKTIKAEEEKLSAEIRADLYSAFEKEEAEKLEKLLPTLPALSLVLEDCKNASKQELIKKAVSDCLTDLQSLVKPDTKLPSSDELTAKILEASTSSNYKEAFKELVEPLTGKGNLDRSNLQKYAANLRRAANLGEHLLKNLDAIVQIDAKLAGQKINPSVDILKLRQKYASRLAEIAKKLEDSELPVGYDPSVHALPSKAVDNARRLAYNKDIISGSYKKILLHILSELGTIEKA
jgi:hypothetical protein